MSALKATGLAVALVAGSGIALFAIGGNKQTSAPSLPPGSPEALATNAFNSGLKHLNNGDKAEAKAATQQKPSDVQKTQNQARDEYDKALKDFKKATELMPEMHRAYNGMGYAYRKAGDYTRALENYDRALKLAPNFTDAIEYRGEAYLGLNRVDDAKQAYLQLFAGDRAKADVLMKAMKAWVEKRRADPAGLDPGALVTFEGWLRERAELAGKTANMAQNAPAPSWR